MIATVTLHVDTMPLHWRAWQVIAAKYKLHFPQDRFYALGGVPSRDILKMLAREQGVTFDHIQAAHEKENVYLPLMAQVEPIHAVVEIAKANHGKIPMAVASGGDRADHCAGAGAFENPAFVRRGGDERDGENQKPARYFLEAARLIGVEPKTCRGLRRYGTWIASDSRGRNGRGGCAGIVCATEICRSRGDETQTEIRDFSRRLLQILETFLLGEREKLFFACSPTLARRFSRIFLCQAGDSNLSGSAAIERQRSSIVCSRSAKLIRSISSASIMAEK